MSSSAAGSPNSSRYVEFDEYVDLKLQKTRSTIKTTDLLVALAGVAAMFLGYLLIFVVLDQWVVPGGFGTASRWILLSTLVLLTVAWLGWKVGLPYLRTVNRLFAAQEIEKADPELNSSLLNLVDLRESGREVNASILRTLEKRAAVELQKIDVTQAIDHRPLMRTAYVLLAVVVLFCLYALISPKKISNSIWRSLLPAANVGVATRTEILNVLPGDVTVLAREHVEVAADIAGEVPDKVALYFSTSDGAFQNERVELRTDGPGQTRFKGILHGENGKGILQSLTYVIRAGDAESREYRIQVKQPPQASGHHVRIEFPSYMKLEPIEQVGGQIDSWEGAKVTVSARTNISVKSARIELLEEAVARQRTGEEIPAAVASDGMQLTSTWTLGFRSDGSYAKAYHIQCKTESGESDPSPIASSLTIRPDLPPEVAILEPVRDIEAPSNAVIPMLIEARDPDFELSHVHLHIKKNGQPVDRIMLTDGRQQRLLIKHDLKLDQRMALMAGDLVELWVEAFDNKQPRPNRKSTPELKVRIVEPVTPKQAEEKLAQDKQNRDQRLQEAEREQNPEQQRPDQPMQNAGNEPGRDPREEQGQQGQPMPNRQPAANEKKPTEEEGKSGEAGQSKAQGENPGKGSDGSDQQGKQSESKGGSGKQKQSSKQTGGSDQQLSSNGEDDKEALEKLLQHGDKPPKGSGNQTSKETKPQNGKNQQDQPGKSNGGQDQQAGQPESPESTEQKQDGGQPAAQGKSNDQKSRGSEQGPKTGDGTQPMPKRDGMDETSKPDAPESNPQNSGTDSKQPQQGASGKEPKSDPQNQAPGKSSPAPDAKSDSARNPNPSADDSKQDKNAPGPKSEPRPDSKSESKSNDPGSNGSPQPNAAADPAGKATAEKDKTSAGKEGKQGSEENPAGKSESKPPMPGAGEKSNPSDKPMADGSSERTADSSDAKREAASGNETGPAKPDRDPQAKPTPSKNPGLERDPNEKPATRPGESRTNDPTQTKNGEPSGAKPQPGKQVNEKIDQPANDSEKSADAKRTEKQDGSPSGANEPQQGKGGRQQRSNPPEGGEGGSSKQDSEGNKGSKESGKGDETQRPGKEQTSDKQSGQQGGEKKPGAGSKSPSGEGQKTEGQGDQPGDSAAGKPMPKENNPGESDPSGTPRESADQKREPSGKSQDSEQPGSKKSPSKSDQAQSGQQSTDRKQGDKQQPDGKQGGDQPAKSGQQEGSKGESGSDAGQGKPGGKQADPSGKGKMTPGGKDGRKAGDGALGNREDAAPGGNNEAAGTNESTVNDGDAANLEYKKQATELVLKRLQDQLDRGDVDPELLQQLGWTEADMRRFTDRMSRYLQESKSTEETPESAARRQQFEEMLKSLDLKKRGVSRSGENATQREVKQVESRQSTVPQEYRSAFDKFTKELARQKSPSAKPTK